MSPKQSNSMLPQFNLTPSSTPRLPSSPRFHSPGTSFFNSWMPGTPALSDGGDSDSDVESSALSTPQLNAGPFSGASESSSWSKQSGLKGLGFECVQVVEDDFEERERRRRAHGSNRQAKTFEHSFQKPQKSHRSRLALYVCLLLVSAFAIAGAFLYTSPAAASVQKTVASTTQRFHRPQAMLQAPSDVRAFTRGRKQAPVKVKTFSWGDVKMEFASVVNTILSGNALPPLDPTLPVDPEVVLEFDPYTATAELEILNMEISLWAENPVVLVYRHVDADTRLLRNELDNLHILPAPVYIDLNNRPDTDVLVGLFNRLAGVSGSPMLIIGGQVIGGWAEAEDLIKNEQLKPLVHSSGAQFLVPKRTTAEQVEVDEVERAMEEDVKRDHERRKRAQFEEERLRREAL